MTLRLSHVTLLLALPFLSNHALALVPFLPGYSPAGEKITDKPTTHGNAAGSIFLRDGGVLGRSEPQEDSAAENKGEDHGLRRRHYGQQGRRDFLLSVPLSLPVYLSNTPSAKAASAAPEHDAIIIGSGLAGLVSALTILDRGGSVVVLEKEAQLGGNSKKASSGINGLSKYAPPGDSLDLFEHDTYQSHHEPSEAAKQLIDTLVENSESALQWLESRLKVDITQVAQLGGHSHPRTHRPKRGMIGATLMVALFEQLRAYADSGKAKILTGSKAESLIAQKPSSSGDGAVVGVRYRQQQQQGRRSLHQTVFAPRTIMAAGGFAASKKLLRKFKPELAHLPTTSGPWATGDGLLLATAVGAAMADMSKVQVHPTGWVDPSEPAKQSKVLAAEVLRGLGGIMLDQHGRRYVGGTIIGSILSRHVFAFPSTSHTFLSNIEGSAMNSGHESTFQRKCLPCMTMNPFISCCHHLLEKLQRNTSTGTRPRGLWRLLLV